jgi:pimeloyl-ACP methyl ester carboxylesterase
MFRFASFLLLIFSTNIFAQTDYVSGITAFRAARETEYKTSATSPFCDRKLFTKFKGLKWYPIDESNKVTAKLRLTPNEPYIDNPTFSNKEAMKARKYGVLTFTLQGQEFTLNAYELERVKGYVFVPFYDLTNQDETYNGGRYVDISRTINPSVIIDFNKAYNPDCAYDDCNTCPMPAVANRLSIRVEAGEKLVDKAPEKPKKADKVKEEKKFKVEKVKEPKIEKAETPKVEKPKETKVVKVETPKVKESKPEKPTEMSKVEPISGSYADFDGVRVAYQESGKGKEAIIFVHGWTSNRDFWAGQTSGYFPQHTIAIDLPGHGKSDKPKVNYSIEYFAKSIEAVMKKTGVKKAVLVGHSMGTPIIRQFYRLYPEQVMALVIVDGALRPFAPKAVIDQFMAPMKADYAANSPAFIEGMLGTMNDENLKNQIRNSTKATPEYVAISAMEGMGEESLYAKDKIDVPVMAILAEASFGQQKDLKEFLGSFIPNLDLRMWQGVGHFLMMEKPQEFNQSLRFFINKNQFFAK